MEFVYTVSIQMNIYINFLLNIHCSVIFFLHRCR